MNADSLQTLWHALQRTARAEPHRPLLCQAARQLTAAGLLAAAERTATALASAGVRALALAAEDGPDWVVIDLACALAGVVAVPVPPFFSPRQIAHLLDAAAVDAIAGRIAVTGPDPTFRPAAMLLPGVELARRPAPPPAGMPPGTAKITFTSGSTGTPKGVCLGLAQQLRVAEAVAAAVASIGIRHLCALPLATLLENVAGVYGALLAGGSVHFDQPPRGQPFGIAPVRLPEAIARHRPHSLILVPELLRALVAAARAGWTPPGSLRFVAVGGGRVAPRLITAARAHGLPVYEGYGLSECGSVVSFNTPAADRPGSAGRPLGHVQVAARNGELVVSGNAFLGYLHDPASWDQTEVASGDLGRIDAQGYLHVDGRRDHLIVTTEGRNIAPEWLESELLAGDLLRHALVIGDGRPHCVALLWPSAPTVADAALAQHVARINADLPAYAHIRAWLRPAEPLTPASGLITGNGRLRRAAVAAHFADLIASLYPPAEAAS